MTSHVKFAVAAALGGVFLAVIFAAAKRPPSPPNIDPGIIEVDEEREPLRPALQRCRSVTAPDPYCDAVWAAQRQHFFQSKDKAQ
jgi:conjugative transfer region protein TrbK